MSLLTAMLKTGLAGHMDRGALQRLQRKRLKKLLRYARANSPFYRERYAALGEDPRLEELPPVSKPELMSHFDRVLTDRGVTMDRVEAFTRDPDNVGRMLDGRCLVFRTSGSTGNPAVVLYDKTCIEVSSAVAALRTFARKEDLRVFLRRGKKTAGIFAASGFYLACGMSRYLQLKMPRRQTKLTVDVNAPEEEIVRELNAFQPAMLSGYPSNLALLAEAPGLDIHPSVVITGGELLTDRVRKVLTERFGCTVQTHYSCTEGGEVACECREGRLHLNEDWVIAEPVDENGALVGSGVLSHGLLITNLANFLQPFIRYELTDRVILHDEPCPCGRHSRWLEIEGRTDDTLLFPGGVKIAPMSLYKLLEEVEGVRRFQLRQTGPSRLELRLVSDAPDAAFSAAEAALRAYLAEKGVTDTELLLSPEPPAPDPVSGKFKHVSRTF